MHPHFYRLQGRPSFDQSSDSFALQREIADSARQSLSLVESHGIRLQFLPVSDNGVCVANATANPTNAYKVRGALVSAERARREGFKVLVTASAGNHGAGLAYAAARLGMEAVVYVPTNAPRVKVDTIRRFGAQVRLVGSSFDESLEAARRDRRVAAGVATFVHPFDDPHVVAGQGTIGFEIVSHVHALLQSESFEKVRIFLPVGGGGLIAGVASVVRSFWPDDLPKPDVVGVIDESSPAAFLSLMRGRRVTAMPDTIADGTKVAEVGDIFLSVVSLVDYLLLVPHDDIVNVMRECEGSHGIRLEGAGALAVAGDVAARRYNLFNDKERTLSVPVLSGTNIDPERFEKEVNAKPRLDTKRSERKAFDVAMMESPGELLRFLLSVKDFNIASLTHRRSGRGEVARVRVEFEVARGDAGRLVECLDREFPGSQQLMEGEHMLYRVEPPAMTVSSEQLVGLRDYPGAFLEYVEGLTRTNSLRSVDFLFYRKPANPGSDGQVVIGFIDDDPRAVQKTVQWSDARLRSASA